MSHGWRYSSGDWWLTCDVCSKKIPASESRKRWDGLQVCKDDFEMRHPMDFIKTKLDKITVPFTRPQSVDIFKDIPYYGLYVANDYIDDHPYQSTTNTTNYVREEEPA